MSGETKRLNEVMDTFAPEGANDRRWFFVEHQLEQIIISARSVVATLVSIESRPENAQEVIVADDCLSYMKPMLRYILSARASFLSCLSGTSVSERISRKEL
jgi:hypothetical protein